MSIPQFIGAVLDNITMIFGGGFLVYFFWQKKPIKWIAVLGVFPICLGLYQIYGKYGQFKDERVPSKEFVQKKVEQQSVFAQQDMTLSSEEGYSILIPSGYSYTEFPTTSFSLVAVNKATHSSLAVNRFEIDEPLSKVISDASNYLQETNATYKLHYPVEFNNNGTEGRLVFFEVVKDQGPIKGYMIYYASGHTLFQVVLSSLQSDFATNDPVFTRIRESFTLRQPEKRQTGRNE